jgi:hypothetical protein
VSPKGKEYFELRKVELNHSESCGNPETAKSRKRQVRVKRIRNFVDLSGVSALRQGEYKGNARNDSKALVDSLKKQHGVNMSYSQTHSIVIEAAGGNMEKQLFRQYQQLNAFLEVLKIPT